MPLFFRAFFVVFCLGFLFWVFFLRKIFYLISEKTLPLIIASNPENYPSFRGNSLHGTTHHNVLLSKLDTNCIKLPIAL